MKLTVRVGIVFLFIIVLMSLSLLFRDPVRTIKHGSLPIQSYQTTLTNSMPLHYDLPDFTITFAVPPTTEVQASPDKGEELKFSTYLVNHSSRFRGYVQLWQLKDLERFLNYSKSLSPFDFKSYRVSSLEQSEYHGFITQWTAEIGEGMMSGKDYWLKINNSEVVVRVSLLSDSADFPNELDTVSQQIIDSLQIDIKYLI